LAGQGLAGQHFFSRGLGDGGPAQAKIDTILDHGGLQGAAGLRAGSAGFAFGKFALFFGFALLGTTAHISHDRWGGDRQWPFALFLFLAFAALVLELLTALGFGESTHGGVGMIVCMADMAGFARIAFKGLGIGGQDLGVDNRRGYSVLFAL